MIGMLALRLSQGCGGPESCNSTVKYRMLRFEAKLRRVGAGRARETPEAVFEDGLRLYAAGQYAAAASKLGAAVKGGHMRAHATLAWLLLFGRQGVRRSRRKGLRLAEAGARLGCCDCSGIAAYCRAQGYGGLLKDKASALQLARGSTAAGSRYGQLVMGMLYLSRHVEGLVRNVPAAFAHYRLAASQGLDDAQFRLGHIDVLDHEVSDRWYRQAADQGHPEACWNVATHYLVCAELVNRAEARRGSRWRSRGGLLKPRKI